MSGGRFIASARLNARRHRAVPGFVASRVFCSAHGNDKMFECSRSMPSTIHTYEVRPRDHHRDVDLISDVLRFGRLWYDTPDDAIGYAMHSSRSHDAVIRVYDVAGNVIRDARAQGRFQRVVSLLRISRAVTREDDRPMQSSIQQLAYGVRRKP